MPADATVEDDALTLQAGGVTIELATDAPDDLESLLGRTWTAIGTVSDGAVSRLPVDTRRPRLDVVQGWFPGFGGAFRPTRRRTGVYPRWPLPRSFLRHRCGGSAGLRPASQFSVPSPGRHPVRAY